VRHGLGALVGLLGLSPLLPRRLRTRVATQQPVLAVHLRQALEELGPTFIKLGQVLSLRADLLPPEFVRELSLLQDRVPRRRPPGSGPDLDPKSGSPSVRHRQP